MKNIYEILKSLDIEIEDKEKFDKSFNENYKTIAEFEKKTNAYSELKCQYDADIEARDSKLEELQKRLNESGNDKEAVDKAKKDLEQARKRFEEEKKEHEEAVAKKAYENKVAEAIADFKFSSNSAREQFTQKLIEKNLSIEDGKLLGLSDFVDNYKEHDADAFVEESNEPKPKFSTGSSSAGKGEDKTTANRSEPGII